MVEKKSKFEYTVFTCILFLVIFGLLVLYSSSSVASSKIYDNSIYLFLRQSIFCIIGIVLALVISFIPYKIYSKFSKYFFITCLMLVIMTVQVG